MEAWLQHRRLKRDLLRQHNTSDDSSSNQILRATPPEKSEDHVVSFDDDDPHDPRRWTWKWRLFYLMIVWWLVFVTGWASSADSTGGGASAKVLHVSNVAESLSTAMFLFGVAIGAIFAGPTSESVGRFCTFMSTFLVYMIWVMASALSPNYGSQIVFRFLSGLFASASMSIYGGTMADLFATAERSLVWPFFALSPMLGPIVAPLVSGWVAQYVGWRYVDWLTLGISGAAFLLAALCLPETFSPVILAFKASILREMTGDITFMSDFEQQSKLPKRLADNMRRIGYFVFRELTTVLFGLYLTLIYILVYGFLQGFQFIWSNTYHFDVGQRYVSFGTIAVGMIVALPYMLLFNHFSGSGKTGKTPRPEQKLRPTLLTAPLLTGSLFWLGWANRPDISHWSDLTACFVFGFSIFALFTATYHYLLDSYSTNAASAMAAVTFMRYMASGGMVIATDPLYEAIGVAWSLTLFGCIAALLTPVPWLFWLYGSRIRSRSKWAFSDDEL